MNGITITLYPTGDSPEETLLAAIAQYMYQINPTKPHYTAATQALHAAVVALGDMRDDNSPEVAA